MNPEKKYLCLNLAGRKKTEHEHAAVLFPNFSRSTVWFVLVVKILLRCSGTMPRLIQF